MSRKKAFVAILLCTYNGEAYIRKQLASIKAQSYTHWVLYVSDDGSTDSTLALIDQFAHEVSQKVIILHGPQKGFGANFLSLICNPNICAEYFAYCDQDDIWHEQKLQRSIETLRVSKAVPALYCGRTVYINQQDEVIGCSHTMKKSLSFRNALVQCVAGGNTMLINAKLRSIIQKYGKNIPIYSHDWWTYILVTLHSGTVHYDEQPMVYYRQHGQNTVGKNTGISDKLVRLKLLLSSTFRGWNRVHLTILKENIAYVNSTNRQALEFFYLACTSTFFYTRVIYFIKSNVYRQKRIDSIVFLISTLLKKI